MSVDYHVAQYAKIVEDLKAEIQQLKDKISSMECLAEENKALRNQTPQIFVLDKEDEVGPDGQLPELFCEDFFLRQGKRNFVRGSALKCHLITHKS